MTTDLTAQEIERDVAKFHRACKLIKELNDKGYHFFTGGSGTITMLDKHKEDGGTDIAHGIANIEGGDW